MNGNKLTVGSLFSGIGGIEYGLERTGCFETKWQCEINEYARKVLEKNWPNIKIYEDVKDLCITEYPKRVDVITGGFPCQPFSTAGRRRGESDERFLWPEFMRVIRSLQPRWVVVENVPGLLTIDSGRTFARILWELSSGGYIVEWDTISAASIGALHPRNRLFIVGRNVAYPLLSDKDGINGGAVRISEGEIGRCTEGNISPRCGKVLEDSRSLCGGDNIRGEFGTDCRGGVGEGIGAEETVTITGSSSASEVMADTEHNGFPTPEVGGGVTEGGDRDKAGENATRQSKRLCEQYGEVANPDSGGLEGAITEGWDGEYAFGDSGDETEISIPKSERGKRWKPGDARFQAQCGTRLLGWCSAGVDDFRRRQTYWQVEPDVGRVANGIPSRVDRLKCLGNAVVPQVAQYIGECIIRYERGVEK